MQIVVRAIQVLLILVVLSNIYTLALYTALRSFMTTPSPLSIVGILELIVVILISTTLVFILEKYYRKLTGRAVKKLSTRNFITKSTLILVGVYSAVLILVGGFLFVLFFLVIF